MRVYKRSGSSEPVSFDKILQRIQRLCAEDGSRNLCALPSVDVAGIAQKVIQHLSDGVTTAQLDEHTATTAASMVTVHPDYGTLASRVTVSNHQKNTPDTFLECVRLQKTQNYDNGGSLTALVSDELVDIAAARSTEIESVIDYNRDYDFDTFGFATLLRGYLARITDVHGNQRIVERPQHMWMRVSLGIHGDDLEAAFETYNMMSQRMFTHASPALYNAGTNHPQMSSSFLMTIKDDSIDGIYETLTNCARISKYAGGIGVSIQNVRASGSLIRGTNGKATGLVPMLRNFNATARYVNQGGKRLGSFAMYCEPWHADVYEFLDMRKNHGNEETRGRDLFYSMWIPDLFMQRVVDGGSWSLFCPDECRGLPDAHGKAFEDLYTRYEQQGKARRVVSARDLWEEIIKSQIETGTPYLCYKDACNSKSNQRNLGTIKSSNLCAEIVEYTDASEIAVCNLASICLPAFVLVNRCGGGYDYAALKKAVKTVVRNLNKVIDRSFYPVPEAETFNLRHRPVGVGVQGLADAFAMMRVPFESPEAVRLNKNIFETIYFGCIEASCELAAEFGPYETYEGSPASEGLLQFDLWGVRPDSDIHDWDALKAKVAKHGLRNSLLVALMPTASTSQIMGFSESFEPFSGILYERRTIAGNFKLVNRYLMNDLLRLGIWNSNMKDRIIAAGGSIQGFEDIPKNIRDLYKTVWEIKQRALIDLQADRGPYVCQSASNNLYIHDPEVVKLSNMHIYAWSKGLKTGCYYLRVAPKLKAQQFTIDPRLLTKSSPPSDPVACSRDNPGSCEMCSA